MIGFLSLALAWGDQVLFYPSICSPLILVNFGSGCLITRSSWIIFSLLFLFSFRILLSNSSTFFCSNSTYDSILSSCVLCKWWLKPPLPISSPHRRHLTRSIFYPSLFLCLQAKGFQMVRMNLCMYNHHNIDGWSFAPNWTIELYETIF